MKRFLLTFAAVGAMVAVAPATALAQHHRGRLKSRNAKAHRVHFKRFGSLSDQSTGSSGNSESAGTVQSFDSTSNVLKILLNDGTTTVSGTVTNDTRLTCTSSSSSQGSEDNDQDDNGSSSTGDDGSGGDNGGSSQGDSEHSGQQTGDNDQDESSEQSSGDDQDESSAQTCDTSKLKSGTTVLEAELRISSRGSTWESVRLAS